ncbi:MAG: site-specific integrase [Chitinophagales bacterium]
MKNTASIKPILYTHKTLSNGKHPIILQIIKDRRVKRISLGYSALKTEWDFKHNRPSKKYQYKAELEAVIKKKEAAFAKQVLALDLETENFTAEALVRNVKKKRNKASVSKYFDEVIGELKKANRIGNAEVYTLCRNVVKTFAKNVDIQFNQIDWSWLCKFETDCIERGCKESTISNYLRTLRALFNRAIKDKIITLDIYPFRDYKIGKLNLETQKRALRLEQIELIEKKALPIESRLWQSRSIFLFSFYTMGTNIADIANLTWDNIKDNRLKYERAKTGKLYNVFLNDKALKILKHYKANQTDKYIFPIYIENTHQTAQQKNDRLHKVMRQTNDDLRTIAEKLEIEENLTTYVARHSAATVLKRRGVSTTVISELLGHESEEITQTYLDSFENSVLDTAVSLL